MELTYNQAVKELEQLIQKMQDPACDIDHLAEYTKRSKELLELCRRRLTTTDNEIKALLAGIEPQAE